MCPNGKPRVLSCEQPWQLAMRGAVAQLLDWQLQWPLNLIWCVANALHIQGHCPSWQRTSVELTASSKGSQSLCMHCLHIAGLAWRGSVDKQCWCINK